MRVSLILLSVSVILFLIVPAESLDTISVVTTNPDFISIIKEIGGDAVTVESIIPPGSDPHSFSISRKDIEILESADLVVLTNSEDFSFERKIKDEYVNTLDIDDYRLKGAEFDDFPEFSNNPHGYWLKVNNSIAIARAVAEKLSRISPEKEGYFSTNLLLFENKMREVDRFLKESKMESRCLAVIPGVAYIIQNAGLETGAILLEEGLGFTGDYVEIERKLSDSEMNCIVVPESMKNSKPGEIAEQLSKDTGKPVIYVRFVAGGESLFSLHLYNLMQFVKAFQQCSENQEEDNSLILLLVFLLMLESVVIAWLWRR